MHHFKVKSSIFLLLSLTPFAAQATPLARPNPPPIRPVVETYFDTPITDPYRYMENINDPTVLSWIEGQGQFTRAVFDSIPARMGYAKTIADFAGGFDFIHSIQVYGGRSFYEERVPGSDNFDLIVREADGKRRPLVDVGALRAAHGGTPYSINYFQAAPDGKRVAVGVSSGGSEDATMTVYDVATGRPIGQSFDRAAEAQPTFTDNGSAMVFTLLQKLPPNAPKIQKYINQSVFVWNFKDPPSPVFGYLAKNGPAIPSSFFPDLVTIPGANVIAAEVTDGVHPEYDLWLSPLGAAVNGMPKWTHLLAHDDGVTAIDIVGDKLFLLSHKDAPTFQILSLKLGAALSTATVVLPVRSDRVIESIHGATDGLYVTVREGVYSKLVRIRADGAVATEIPLPFKGSISEIFTDERAAGATIIQESWVVPPRTIAVNSSGMSKQLAFGSTPASYDQDAFEALALNPTAKDGTLIPLSYVRMKQDRKPQIVLLQAYGSYGYPTYPGFSPRMIPFMQTGHAAFATCHVRGGGELGEAWRLGGKDANKPNTWRDLIACGEYLIAKGYTTRDKLFIDGASAGGIAVGMAMTERPDMWAGVLDEVPVASALRHEYQANGPANIPEFGTVKNPQNFRNLLAMDSYQHVKNGVAYPPVFLTTGLNDPRVDPWQPAKMTARLLASGTKNAILLRVEDAGGHGIGTTKSQADALVADKHAFIFWQAGVPGWQPELRP